MGYRGGDISKLFAVQTVRPPTRRALRNIADAGGRAMTEAARANTPRQTGATAEAWRQRPVTQRRDGTAESGTENPSHKARWLEHGTRPHEVKPRRADALATPEGARAEADHPGTPAYHPLARAAAEIELSLQAIAEPHLRAWAEEVEVRAARHRGIERT